MPKQPKKNIRSYKPRKGAYARFLKSQVDADGKQVLRDSIQRELEKDQQLNNAEEVWDPKPLTAYERAMQRWHQDHKNNNDNDFDGCA